jgi:hypothetical protein
MHVGFNFREGLVVNDIRYDGRSVLHRLSISDMVSHTLYSEAVLQLRSSIYLTEIHVVGDIPDCGLQ